MVDLVKVGSETAKSGFENERDVIAKFENWKQDIDAQKWLKIMDYNISKIKKISGIVIHGEKAGIQIQITIKTKDKISKENLSLKKSTADFNQIDKRWIKNYIDLWNIPSNVVTLLKMFTGELSPKELVSVNKITKEKYGSLRDKRRLLSQEDVRISPQGSLYIGKITMQRKGGDGGRPTANMLQFKMKPNDLF